MLSRSLRLPFQDHEDTLYPLPFSSYTFQETRLNAVPAGHMNVFQSIVTAPNEHKSSEGGKSTRSSSDVDFEEINSHIPTSRSSTRPSHHTPSIPTSISSPEFTTHTSSNAFEGSIEITDTRSTARWVSDDRELQRASELHAAVGTKRSSSKISPHLSTATGPPPTKKQHRHQREYTY